MVQRRKKRRRLNRRRQPGLAAPLEVMKRRISFSPLIARSAESGARNAQRCAIKSKLLVYMAILRQSVIPHMHTVAPASQLKG
jgi:hypothetical protein